MNATPAQTLPSSSESSERRALGFLADLSQTLALSLDLHQTLNEAVTRIASYMQAQAASLFLLDPDGQTLECHICVGPVNVTGVRLKVGQGVVGRTVAENTSQIVRDAQHDPRFNTDVDNRTGFVTRSIVCTPLSTARGPIGALQVLNKIDGGLFEADDIVVLRLLAAPTALAINNARMAHDLVEQQRIRRELEMARRLQKSLLPKRRRDGFPLRGINLSAHETSGDFYDYFDLPDGRIGFLIGDVAGKGLNAAFLMVRTASLLRWAGKDGLAPCEWLKRANEEVCQSISEGMFVCALVGQYDRRNRSVVFASAGFPPALHFYAATFKEYVADGPPLGVLPGIIYGESKIECLNGSLYFYSDGVSDVRDAQHRTIGAVGLQALIARYAQAAPESRLRAIINEIKHLTLVDDTTVLLLEEANPGTDDLLLQREFPARAEELRELRTVLRHVLNMHGVAADLRDKLILAVDEACCNIIRHGYGNTDTGSIALKLTREDDTLKFELRDTAAPIDPKQIRPRDLSECRPGGLGVNFIDALMDEWRIEPAPSGVGNVLTMRKRIPATPGENEA